MPRAGRRSPSSGSPFPHVVHTCSYGVACRGCDHLKREHRLRTKAEFERARTGGRVTRPEFVLYHFARGAPDAPRVGFTVGRRIGGAVVRNRTRRKLREAIRALIPRLVACDVVVVARPPAVGARVADLELALTDAAARAGLLQT